MTAALEAALARHRFISIAAIVALILLAWAWLVSGAGMAMDPLVSLSPVTSANSPMSGMAMDSTASPPTAWSVGRFALIFSMWLIMMVAMMLPSAAPTILLYARAATHGRTEPLPATHTFLAGYLAAWAIFSLVAAGLQLLFEAGGLLAPMLMVSQSRWLSVAILVAAGLYQLSPLKDVCLRHCRNPAQFLSSHYRPGRAGALRMGFVHGSYCVGCCWLLMALLFLGGVMNLAWIALLTLMVALEKLLPHGRLVAIVSGMGCLTWGAAIALG